MSKVNIKHISQDEHENGCWIACLAMILSFHRNGEEMTYETMEADLAEKGYDVEKMNSAADVLAKEYGYGDDCLSIDDKPLPMQSEIQEHINKNKIFLCCLHNDAGQKGKLITDVRDGHWIIISGYEEDKLIINDPGSSDSISVVYDNTTYSDGMYWGNSTYLEKHK